jgi:positive regulator of sigma E activity
MHQQLWGYKIEEKLYVGVREQKLLNTTGLVYSWSLIWSYILQKIVHQNLFLEETVEHTG